MEFLSNRFKQKVGELLRSERPLIAVVHCNYAKLYEKTWTLFQVTAENREEIVNTVVSKFMNDRP